MEHQPLTRRQPCFESLCTAASRFALAPFAVKQLDGSSTRTELATRGIAIHERRGGRGLVDPRIPGRTAPNGMEKIGNSRRRPKKALDHMEKLACRVFSYRPSVLRG